MLSRLAGIFAFLFWGRDVKAHYNGYNVILNLI